ncbi:ImmA/IrrE family metallo-endopeptidase [Brevibacillus borstelensis]|uniref:ImmA/IrrE family metallo-endopeptidase n=1 Tax=Brevibacillus borstelensis TaxID=45462 RepID=UPI0004F25F34|nr:ImmA/IrrE family metallo-endopeptidase [Brevibacillus borstelensis]KKX53291.1 hypothetical protein X546_20670 [Brevibacillus borstelensis cifa_chp40]
MSFEIISPLYKWNKHYSLAKIRAIEARRKYEIKNGPVAEPVFNYLEKENCIVITFDMGKKTSVTGMYVKKGDTKLILIHKNRVLGQQYFTAAHELSHVLYDEGDMLDICLPQTYRKDEKETLADFFAAHFLMPEEDIISEFSSEYPPKVSKETIVYLSSKYKVTFIAMALRLYALGLISQEEYERYHTQSNKGKVGAKEICIKLGIDYSNIAPTNEIYVSPAYFDLLISVYHKANISRTVLKDHFLRYLEDKLKADFSHILKMADETYPDEVGWDDI